MRLHEEFKLYENLWEDTNTENKSAEDPVSKALAQTPKVFLQFGEFERDWYVDKFNPNSLYGHDQDYGTDHFDSFEYPIDSGDLLCDLLETIIPAHINHVENDPILDEYRRLDKAFNTAANDEQANKAEEALALLVATNLEYFVEIFNDYVLDYYQEKAEDWAYDNLYEKLNQLNEADNLTNKKFFIRFGVLTADDKIEYKEVWITDISFEAAVKKIYAKYKKKNVRDISLIKTEEA